VTVRKLKLQIIYVRVLLPDGLTVPAADSKESRNGVLLGSLVRKLKPSKS